MTKLRTFLRRTLPLLLAAVLLPWPAWAQAPQGAAALRTRHAAMMPMLADSPFNGPLYLESAEGDRTLRGDVHAVIDHPFAAVNAALANPDHWCDVMMLHLNTPSTAGAPGRMGAPASNCGSARSTTSPCPRRRGWPSPSTRAA